MYGIAMFSISTDQDTLTITQDDTVDLPDHKVRFDIDGPPMGRQHLFSSASRVKIGSLVPGEYSITRHRAESPMTQDKETKQFEIGDVQQIVKEVDTIEFDVDDHTVNEVLEYAENNPHAKEYLLEAEKAGQNRKGIVSELS